MALYKRGETWWICISHCGKRIQKTTGTSDKIAAQQYHDKFKADLWKLDRLQIKPDKTWNDAVVKFLSEAKDKRSLKHDVFKLKWLDKHLNGLLLSKITKKVIDDIVEKKEQEGVAPATVNRLLALIRSILRMAEKEWEWIDKAPYVKLRKENNERQRWLQPAEATKLLAELPKYLRYMALFAAVTGLREANVRLLEWSEVYLDFRQILIPARKSKNKKDIAIPLNDDAIAILKQVQGEPDRHEKYVFTLKGRAIYRCSNKSWYSALKRAGIEDFRWHDWRHTWATWSRLKGVSLHDLKDTGNWSSMQMVLRYAHIGADQLLHSAQKITGTLPVMSLL